MAAVKPDSKTATRHDTPVNLPAVQSPEHTPALIEGLSAVYAQWEALRQQWAATSAQFEREQMQMNQQGALLLRAAELAQEDGAAFRDKLEVRRNEANGVFEGQKKAFAVQERQYVERLTALIQARLSSTPIALELMIRTLPSTSILHLHRLWPEDAVALLYAFEERIPSRLEFLSDDSTDDQSLSPPAFYAEGGLTSARPTTAEWRALRDSDALVWPVKGTIPMRLDDNRWIRWLSRGAVLEAEIETPEGFQNALMQPDAEQVVARLLKVQQRRRIQVALSTQ
jgi:hypothetical protein